MAQGDSVYELSNPDHWGVVYQGNLAATPAQPQGYHPISHFKVPFVLDGYTIAVHADNPEARLNWWLACRIYQVLPAPQMPSGEAETHMHRIPLVRTTLVTWPRLAEQYQLFVEIPWWHQKMNITIWQYNGPEGDAEIAAQEDLAQAMRVDLARLELRLQGLLRSGDV